MSFVDVRAGMHTRLRSISGVRNVIGGMPTGIHATPAFVTQYVDGARQGQTNVFHWRFDIHAILEQQANDIAESAIDEMVDAVVAAFSPRLTDSNGHRRATLGGVANMSWFERMASGDTDGYITFGSGESAKVYRHIGFTLVVKTHEEY
jgi:hypothetical protein